MIVGLLVGLCAAALTGVAAYLITLEEYSRHFLDQRVARRMSLQTALASSVFTGILVGASTWALLVWL